MHRYASICAAMAACLAVLSCATPRPAPPAEMWPTTAWPTSTPEAQGVDSALLANAIETLKARNVPIHSLLIERNGYLVLDAYFFPFADNEPHDVASITKSVTSTLVGIAQKNGTAIDVNAPIYSLLASEPIADLRAEKITLAHLLSMTSGLDCSAEQGRSLLAQMETSQHWAEYVLARPLANDPGSRFEYCGGSMHLVSAALTRATGMSAYDFARQQLFAPLGITDVAWPADPDGVSHGFADLRLEPRDIAKLGYLWLHNGQWEGRQLVSPEYLKAALAPQTAVQPGIQYGYGMWLYPGHNPFDFEANGRGGQRVTVIPQWNAVVVVTGGGMDANEVMPLIAGAFNSNTALPPNSEGDAQLARAVAEVATPPPALAVQSPPTENGILDRVFYLPPNPFGAQWLSLALSATGDVALRFGFADGTSEQHPVGLDGSPRLSENLRSGLPVAVSGRWLNGSFALDYDEIARINAYRLLITPDPGGAMIRLTERSGLADMTMVAGTNPIEQRTAGVSGSHG